MPILEKQFTLLTAGFPHGAYQSQDNNLPDLRATSVRGQIRWWFDALFGDSPQNPIFGYVANRRMNITGNAAGKITIRVKASPENQPPKNTAFIPHKGKKGGQKSALPTGTLFQLSIEERRGGLNATEAENLKRAVNAWLLCGGIGQRSNRGAGSVWPTSDAPNEINALEVACSRVLQDSKLSFAILPGTYQNEFELRKVAGDFLADEAFQRCGMPFGSARLRERKPSNLKLKAVHIDQQLRLLAIWDGRSQSIQDLKNGISTLARSKEIGRKLAVVSFSR